MNSETFIHGVKIAHDALYKIQRPSDNEEFEAMRELVNGFIALLGGFREDAFDVISDFLLSHTTYDDEEAYLLYTYIYYDEEINTN